MTLPLTPEMLRQAYEFVCTTPPFNKWNLPDGEDVVFRVVRDPALRGWYRKEGKKHVIAVSARSTGHTASLIAVIAHEAIHLHEKHNSACGSGQHSAAFERWAAETCRYHGFDPKMF
jgi:hypothetical protein